MAALVDNEDTWQHTNDLIAMAIFGKARPVYLYYTIKTSTCSQDLDSWVPPGIARAQDHHYNTAVWNYTTVQ